MAVEWEVEGVARRGPSWRELVNEAARMLGYGDPDLLRMRGTDLQILEYFKIKMGNFAPLTNWLVRNMDPPDSAVCESSVYRALSKMGRCRTFYTTNYDDFLERALTKAKRGVRVIRTELEMGYSDGDAEVVKFHGDFNSPEEMVVSEGHYYKRMRLDTLLDLKLRSDLLGKAVVFVGYSFRDINIAYLFDTVNGMFKELPNSFSGKRAYILVHNPSDFEYRLFHERKIEVIPTYGDDRGASTAAVIEDMIA